MLPAALTLLHCLCAAGCRHTAIRLLDRVHHLENTGTVSDIRPAQVTLGQAWFLPRNKTHPVQALLFPPHYLVSDCSKALVRLLPEQLVASDVQSDRYVWLFMFIHRVNLLSCFHYVNEI